MSVNYRLVSLNLQSAISPNENMEKVYRISHATFLFFIKFEIVGRNQTSVIKRPSCL